MILSISALSLHSIAQSKVVARCPVKTLPVQQATPEGIWVCVLKAKKYRDGIDCPEGSTPIILTNKYDPFKCALVDIKVMKSKGICPQGYQSIPTADPNKEYACRFVSKSYRSSEKCPKGIYPIASPEALKPYTCGIKEKEEDVEEFEIPGQIAFKYPKNWKLKDSWGDKQPSITLTKKSNGEALPISLTIRFSRKTGSKFVSMKSRMKQEHAWHGSYESGTSRVAGRLARHLTDPRGAELTFFKVPGGYYVISYAAPAKEFENTFAAYNLLLKSMRLLDQDERP